MEEGQPGARGFICRYLGALSAKDTVITCAVHTQVLHFLPRTGCKQGRELWKVLIVISGNRGPEGLSITGACAQSQTT